MDKLVLFNNSELNKLLNKRTGESKFGEHVTLLASISNIYDELKNLDVTHVIIGLPEDVGVFANYGKSGTYNTWSAVIKFLISCRIFFSARLAFSNVSLWLSFVLFIPAAKLVITLIATTGRSQ